MFKLYIKTLQQAFKTLPKKLSYVFLTLLVCTSLVSMIFPLGIYQLFLDANSTSPEVLKSVILMLSITAIFGIFNIAMHAVTTYLNIYGSRLFSYQSIQATQKHSINKDHAIETFERTRQAYISIFTESSTLILGTCLQIILALIFLSITINLSITLLCIFSVVFVLGYSFFIKGKYKYNRTQWNNLAEKETEQSIQTLKQTHLSEHLPKWYETIALKMIKNARENFMLTLPVYLLMFVTLIAGYVISFNMQGVAGVILWQTYFAMLIRPIESLSLDLESIFGALVDVG